MPEMPSSDAQPNTQPLSIDSQTVLGGRYQLDGVIARGGMGEIWQATDAVLGRRVAVKMVRRDVVGQPRVRERFETEARNLALIAHPSIATVHDFGEHDGLAYLVMEFVPGESLAARISRDGAMPSEQVIAILDEVASGLAIVHEAGVVHRDIKPANIMITDSGRVKLTDFGIARLSESPSHTATGDVLGTPQYMSPEQLRGESVTPASDVYSLGIVAYEMLTGHPPFSGDSPVVVALAQLHDLPPPLPDSVPRQLVALVGRCLIKNPLERPLDGRAIVSQLGAPSTGDDSDSVEQFYAPTLALPQRSITPPTTSMPVPPTTRMAPTAVANEVPLIGTLRRHETKRRASIAAMLVAVAGLVAAFVLTTRGAQDEIVASASTSASESPAAAETTATAAATATTPVATAAVVTSPPPAPTVMVDPSSFTGRDRGQVADELRALGLVVEERRVDVDEDVERNTVVAVTPSGEVLLGSTVVVEIASPRNDKKDDDD